MFQFIETIKIFQKKLVNLEFHQERVNKTLASFWNDNFAIVLSKEILLPALSSDLIYKLRIEYSNRIEKISISPYEKKQIKKFKVVENNQIDYSFKFKNRENINSMLKNISAEEIIIIRNGFVTDTSYSNLVFSDGKNLITPSTPLLKGTKREFLLQNKLITEDEVKLSDMKLFKHFYLINSMLELTEENKYSVQQISY
jgi:4-amino-4-deoxychorismate lyase